MDIKAAVNSHREFFASRATRSAKFRKDQLKKLRQAISSKENEIAAALQSDLHRSPDQAYFTEIGLMIQETGYIIRNLEKWMKKRKYPAPLLFPLSKFYVTPEPFGTALIISPWNYPFLLTFLPLAAAIAGGNCVMVKPSKASAASARVIADIITSCFGPEHVSVVTPDTANAYDVLKERFDYILFTGGSETGKKVLHAAAESATPVTLELGGKCPCIVHSDCDLEKAAARIAAGKFLNAGQTCVAPDYILAHRPLQSRIDYMIREQVAHMYGPDPKTSPDFGRIINATEFERIKAAAPQVKSQAEDRYIEPTVVESDPCSTLMKEEVFGPVLPVVYYDTIEEAVDFVNSREKPLVLYVFSKNKKITQQVLSQTSSGNAAVNDTVVFLSNVQSPFGGAGASGYGRYRGKAGFDTFSNMKTVMEQTNLFDITLRYPPLSKMAMRLIRLLVR